MVFKSGKTTWYNGLNYFFDNSVIFIDCPILLNLQRIKEALK
jgi:hypothetical protein